MADAARPRFIGGKLGLDGALYDRVRRGGKSESDLAGVTHLFVSRWSKEDDEGAAEQLGRTLAQFSSDPRVSELGDRLGEDAFSNPIRRLEHGIIGILGRDVYDIADSAVGESTAWANQVVGYLYIGDGLAIFRASYSGSIAGAIFSKRGERTNLYTETIVQLLKLFRFVQDEGAANAWQLNSLNVLFSTDFTRAGRYALEIGRLASWVDQLNVSWFLGLDEQPTDRMGQLLTALRASEAESKGHDTTTRSNKGIIDHLTIPERAPSAESHLSPWLRHKLDPRAIDGRARSGGASGSLLLEWDLDIIPAVRQWLVAHDHLDGAALDNFLALLLVAHEVPTTPAAKSTGRRNSNYALLLHPAESGDDSSFDARWLVARRRARQWLLDRERFLLEVVPPVDDPQHEAAVRRNRFRLRRIEEIRTGIQLHKRNLPKTEDPNLSHYGSSHLPVYRDNGMDRGYVEIIRDVGWPPEHNIHIETRSVLVPAGTFPGLEVPIDDATARMVVEIEVLGEPVLDSAGEPVPWTAFGLPDHVFETFVDRRHQRREAGGGKATNPLGRNRNVLPHIPDFEIPMEGESWQVHVSAKGAWSHRNRQIFRRPAAPPTDERERPKGWGAIKEALRRKEAGVPRTEGVRCLDGVDISGYWVATIQERLLLRTVADGLRKAARSAVAGDVMLHLPRALRSSTQEQECAQLSSLNARLEREIAELEVDAEGQQRLAGRALLENDEAGADEARQLRSTLRQQADRLRRELDGTRVALAELESQDQSQEFDVDPRRLEALIELLSTYAGDDHRGVASGEMTRLADICAEVFTNWRLRPGDHNRILVSCTARIQTTNGDWLELDVEGSVLNTRNARDSQNPETLMAAREVTVHGTSVDDAIRSTSAQLDRTTVVKRTSRVLVEELAMPARMALPAIDHPFPIARRVLYVIGSGEQGAVQWSPGYEEIMRAAYYEPTHSWDSAACPTDMAEVHQVAACLAQHPRDGVTLIDLSSATGIDEQRIEWMATPLSGPDAHVKRPRFFRWVDEGVVGLQPCDNAACPAKDGYASVTVLLPETNPTPGDVGGVLCPSCRCLVGHPKAPFPPEYFETPVTGVKGAGGSILDAAVTRAASPPRTPTVPANVYVSQTCLAKTLGVDVMVVRRALAEPPAVASRRMKRGEDRAFVPVWPRDEALAAIRERRDVRAYQSDMVGISEAARRLGISNDHLRSLADKGIIRARKAGGRRRFAPEDLDSWMARKG